MLLSIYLTLQETLSLICILTPARLGVRAQSTRTANPSRAATPSPPDSIISSIATNESMTTRRTPLMDISNNDATSSPVATGSRRKSGRAVKVPEKFVPEVTSSQPGPASAKRKRAAEDVENDASELDEDSEESDATVESAAEEEVREERRRAKKTKKPAAKKPKVNGTTAHDETHAVKLPARPKNSGKRVAIAAEDVEGLYGTRFVHELMHGFANCLQLMYTEAVTLLKMLPLNGLIDIQKMAPQP